MTDNVLIAIIGASAVAFSAICVLGGPVFAYIASNRNLDRRFEGVEQRFVGIEGWFVAIDKRLDKIEHTLELIQADMVKWYEQIFKIKAHIKLD